MLKMNLELIKTIFGPKYWTFVLVASLITVLFNLLRFLWFRRKLVDVIKKQKVDLIDTSRDFSIYSYIKEPEEVGIDSIDLLRFKMHRSVSFLQSFLSIFVIALAVLIIVLN